MSESRISLDELSSLSGKEIARLQRLAAVDPKLELQLRVWPFLRELAAALYEDEEEEAGPEVPVELIAQAVGLILGLAKHLGQPVSADEVQAVTARAAEISEALIALVDPDELADYLAAEGVVAQAPASTVAPQVAEPAATQNVIDVTPIEPKTGEAPNA